MEEGNITIDGMTRPLPKPFFVMATQNPVEYEGTYPLPEAQLDRFLLKLKMGYPTQEEEFEILNRMEKTPPLPFTSYYYNRRITLFTAKRTGNKRGQSD